MLNMIKFFIALQVAGMVGLMLIDHPFMLALWLIMVAMTTSLTLGFIISNWFFLALSLIFLGGMMVIFLYFTSVVSSEKISNFNTPLATPALITGILASTNLTESYSNSLKTSFLTLNFILENLGLNFILLFYLMLTLLTVVKLSENFKGSLESSFF